MPEGKNLLSQGIAISEVQGRTMFGLQQGGQGHWTRVTSRCGQKGDRQLDCVEFLDHMRTSF